MAAPLLCLVSPHLSRSPCSCTVTATASTASCSVVAVSVALVSVITASRIFLWPRLLVRVVRPLTLTVDTVQPSMLPTADTESGKSASSEYSVDMEALKVLRKIYYNLRP